MVTLTRSNVTGGNPCNGIDSQSGRNGETVSVSSLNASLLRSADPFPYYFLLSLEAGSPIRAFIIFLLSPFVWFLMHLLGNQELAVKIFIFVSTVGLRFSDVTGVSKAVLPKFYLEDLNIHTYKLFMSCKRRLVVTSTPKIMVEYFLRTHLGVEQVFGTELQVTRNGYCTGFVSTWKGFHGDLLMGKAKLQVLKNVLTDVMPDVGIGSGESDRPFLSACKEAYLVNENDAAQMATVPPEQYFKPLVFHDGRLAIRPTRITVLVILLWLPFGLILATFRLMLVETLPIEIGVPVSALLGMKYRIKGAPPLPLPKDNKKGTLFVCTHRSLLDPIYMCVGIRRKVTALTYSVSWVSEKLSLIKTVCLTRDRNEDAKLIEEQLVNGEDLFVCPEGTTCREPYLLRFSSLFAELTENIVPVGMKNRVGMFHGTSARGYKALDSVFFLMNPKPEYEIIFLERLDPEETVAGGRTGVEVAKTVQKKLADVLGYKCTEFTRKDKYMILAGNDGTVKDKRFMPKKKAVVAAAPVAPVA